MQKILTPISVTLVIMIIFTSCSSKHPSVKTGAIIGGTTGAIAGGWFGAALTKTHSGSGNTLEGALIAGSILGILGAGLGAGTGYAIDAITQDDKKIKEIQASHAFIEDNQTKGD